MKIVIISQSDSGGAGIAALRLHKALMEIGEESHMLVYEKNSNEPNVVLLQRSVFIKIIEHLPLPLFNNKYRLIDRKINEDFECCSFPESIDYFSNHPLVKDADVINLHWIGNRLSYKSFFKNVKKAIVWTLHDMNPFLGCAHFQRDLITYPQWQEFDDSIRKKKEKWIHQSKNISVVNLCEWMKSYAEKSDALSCYPQFLVRNSIDISMFKVYPRRSIREILSISHDEKVLMFVSQYVSNARKGFDILLEAISDLQNCTILIVGTPPEKLKTKCKVQVLGTVKDERYMALLYSCSDVFVLPSREDNLPNTMLESLCCGTPVITMKNGGMTDIVKNGMNGYIASNIDAISFRSAIDTFLKEGVAMSREEISSAAQLLFSPKSQAKGYMAVFRSALANCNFR